MKQITLKTLKGEAVAPLTTTQAVESEKGTAEERLSGLESDPPQWLIDLWEQYSKVGSVSYGKYNKEKKDFELNGITGIKTPEALTIAMESAGSRFYCTTFYKATATSRTFFPLNGTGGSVGAPSSGNEFWRCSNLEVLCFATSYNGISNNTFSGCSKLRKIIGGFIAMYGNAPDMFVSCPLIESFTLNRIQSNLNLSKNPLVDIASFRNLIQNASNTTAITVTVHPDVYAKLTDEGNAEWYALLGEAAAKQINFATT